MHTGENFINWYVIVLAPYVEIICHKLEKSISGSYRKESTIKNRPTASKHLSLWHYCSSLINYRYRGQAMHCNSMFALACSCN
jgi:hypothetical protein